MARPVARQPEPDLLRLLRGLRFPATRGELRRGARRDGADQDVLDALDCLPDRAFASSAEVEEALDETRRRADGAER